MNNTIAIVITLSKNHVHYCKALIASLNHYNPELPIIILKDGVFNTDFFSNKKNVFVVDSFEINKIHKLDLYILLNKLNILFLKDMGYDYDYFIHLDADSLVTNPINIESYTEENDFHILQGDIIATNDEKKMRSLFQYAFNPIDFPEYQFDQNQMYFFSASHIAINKRIIPKLIQLLKKHRYELNKEFLNDKRIRFNDQGFLNLMINYLSHIGKIKVKLNNVGIYGKQNPTNFPLLTLENVQKKSDTGVLFIHYTASSRKSTMRAHNFGDILDFFLRQFHNNLFQYYFLESGRLKKFYFNWFWKRFIGKINHYRNKSLLKNK